MLASACFDLVFQSNGHAFSSLVHTESGNANVKERTANRIDIMRRIAFFMSWIVLPLFILMISQKL